MVAHATSGLHLPATHTDALLRIHQQLASATDSAVFLARALDALCAQLRPTFAHVLLYDQDGDLLTAVASSLPALAAARLQIRPGPAVAQAIKGCQTALFDQPEHAPLDDLLQLPLVRQARPLLLIPLVRLGSPIGALLLGAAPGHPFQPADLTLAELVANVIAGVLYVRRLAEKLSRRDEHLGMVADIAAHVSSSLETREVYRLVVQKLNEYFRVDAGSLMLRDETTDELVFVMTLEAGEEKLFGVRLPPGAGIAGHVAQSQRVYIANDAGHDPLHYKLNGKDGETETRTLLCAPMVVKDQTIGVIELINKHGGPFDQTDAERLGLVANMIGVAIENARLFEFVRQRRERLERLLDRMMTQGFSQEKLLEMLARELATQDSRMLAKFNNPYIVGTPVLTPEMCFGREPLFKRILSVLHQNSLLLYGERRIGKTTVLRQLKIRLQAHDDPEYRFRPVYVDLQAIEEHAFFHTIMDDVLRIFGTQANQVPLRYSPRRAAYSGYDFQHDLSAVIGRLCGPQPGGRIDRLVLLIDEADVMYQYDERVLQEFRRIFMNDYAAYLGVVFAVMDVQRKWKRYESPFYNLFQQIPIPPLTRADTELLARTPVRGRYEYQESAIDLIYQISGGKPMKIQLLCLEAINYIREQSRTIVTPEDIERVGQAVKSEEML
ncbi:MAG: GAF domain-containing protein [Kouleothrix sp.]|nr:GAF domain-containing protein [Kouleothrix sp.]